MTSNVMDIVRLALPQRNEYVIPRQAKHSPIEAEDINLAIPSIEADRVVGVGEGFSEKEPDADEDESYAN